MNSDRPQNLSHETYSSLCLIGNLFIQHMPNFLHTILETEEHAPLRSNM